MIKTPCCTVSAFLLRREESNRSEEMNAIMFKPFALNFDLGGTWEIIAETLYLSLAPADPKDNIINKNILQ